MGSTLAGLGATPASAAEWIVEEIYAAGERHGVSGDWLLEVARCESNLDPNAVSHKLNQNGMHDLGLFQFNPNTWEAWGGGDIWNVYEQSDMAARAFARGDACHWTCAWCESGPGVGG